MSQIIPSNTNKHQQTCEQFAELAKNESHLVYKIVSYLNTTSILWRELEKDEPSLSNISLLIKAGANVNDLLDGDTMLMMASFKGNLLIVHALLKAGADPKFKSQSENTALTLALQTKYYDVAKLLLSHGADIDELTYDKTHLQLLFGYSRNEHIPVDLRQLKFLVQHGANVNVVDDIGYNVLFDMGDIPPSSEVVKILLDAGIDKNHQDKYGDTILHTMTGSIHDIYKDETIKIINMLLERGVDPNITSNSGNTALIHYLKNPENPDDIEIAKLFLKYKTKSKKDGESILDLARDTYKFKIYNLLASFDFIN
jgi:ankyrin repeat protein